MYSVENVHLDDESACIALWWVFGKYLCGVIVCVTLVSRMPLARALGLSTWTRVSVCGCVHVLVLDWWLLRWIPTPLMEIIF